MWTLSCLTCSCDGVHDGVTSGLFNHAEVEDEELIVSTTQMMRELDRKADVAVPKVGRRRVGTRIAGV